MNPDDSIEWRDLGDLFVDSSSSLPNVHHGHLTLPEGLDLDDTIPPLDIHLQDDAAPDASVEPQMYIDITDQGGRDEIEVAPIVTKLVIESEPVSASPQSKDEPLFVKMEDAHHNTSEHSVEYPHNPHDSHNSEPVVTKLLSPGKPVVGHVPSVVKVEDAKFTSALGGITTNITNLNVCKADRTPKRARVPGSAPVSAVGGGVLTPCATTSTGAVGVSGVSAATARPSVLSGVSKGKVEKPAVGRTQHS